MPRDSDEQLTAQSILDQSDPMRAAVQSQSEMVVGFYNTLTESDMSPEVASTITINYFDKMFERIWAQPIPECECDDK